MFSERWATLSSNEGRGTVCPRGPRRCSYFGFACVGYLARWKAVDSVRMRPVEGVIFESPDAGDFSLTAQWLLRS
jgi:hypothetical protein